MQVESTHFDRDTLVVVFDNGCRAEFVPLMNSREIRGLRSFRIFSRTELLCHWDSQIYLEGKPRPEEHRINIMKQPMNPTLAGRYWQTAVHHIEERHNQDRKYQSAWNVVNHGWADMQALIDGRCSLLIPKLGDS